MQLFDKLRLSGNDVDGALVRFSSDAEFYKKYLIRFCSENIAAQVAKAAAELDAQATYEQAHLLKGVSGNLGLNKVYELCCQILALLKENKPQQAYAAIPELIKQNRLVCALISENS